MRCSLRETQTAERIMSDRDNATERSVDEKISNKNYAADVNLSMQYTRWFLTLLGIWPYVISDASRIEKLVSKFLMPFPSVVITLLLIPLVSIPIFRDLTPSQFLLLLAPLSFRASSVLKNLILISRRDAIKFCIQHMKTDWQRIETDEDREIMMKNLRVGRNLTLICVLCLYSGTIFYNTLPFVSPRKVNALNQTIRPITVPGIDIYVDLRAGHNYEIVVFISCLSIFYVSAIISAICNLAAVLVCHACGQIQIVMSRLERLVGQENGKYIDQNSLQRGISFIIRIHVRVLRFASKIDQVLRELCLIEVVAATLIICLVAYMFITERKNTSIMASVSYTTLLISLSFNIFIFCRIGELLKEKCEAVGKAAYMTEWYTLPGKTGLTLVMLITMAHYPRRLTAGRIIELSISTFGNIFLSNELMPLLQFSFF
ncbi:odorant receptor 4-like isoform X2 [Venturia canescens]|uniref:odorant receptor 4-like isoform X2 n=1 Tax=Venturia canescens TaxID=32260 RepID=UPI001C9D35AB|nr:odorant receptor 4-like isoform X2 [Venturia canescens]